MSLNPQNPLVVHCIADSWACYWAPAPVDGSIPGDCGPLHGLSTGWPGLWAVRARWLLAMLEALRAYEGSTGWEFPASYVVLSPRQGRELQGFRGLLSKPTTWPEELQQLATHAAALCKRGMAVEVVAARPEDVHALQALVKREGAHRLARRASSGLGVAGTLATGSLPSAP